MIPTWDQFRSLRDRYPNTFLFFECKLGYLLLHEQAFIAAQVFELQTMPLCLMDGRTFVRAILIVPNWINPAIAELKLRCFGMRSQVIDELPT